MEEEDVLKLALKSLSFEQESLKQAQTNYDVFRKQVSRPILQLFEMSRSDSNRCSWKNGVNRAMQMQTMFNASTRLQSPRQLRLLSKYDGGSPRLASVIDHVATTAFASLPQEIQKLSYATIKANSVLKKTVKTPERIINDPLRNGNGMVIPVSLGPCLKYYSIICQEKELKEFFYPIICRYVHEVKFPTSCELCQRSRFALTAHHLVPRAVHDLALKERWRRNREKIDLNSIAWLCRGCHVHVHRIATPEDLGRHYWTIELLLRRTEIWQFAKTVGRLLK